MRLLSCHDCEYTDKLGNVFGTKDRISIYFLTFNISQITQWTKVGI